MRKKEMKEELYNAELRAVKHFEKLNEVSKKLQNIQEIIKKADENHEMAVLTLKDIKRELAMCDH